MAAKRGAEAPAGGAGGDGPAAFFAPRAKAARGELTPGWHVVRDAKRGGVYLMRVDPDSRPSAKVAAFDMARRCACAACLLAHARQSARDTLRSALTRRCGGQRGRTGRWW